MRVDLHCHSNLSDGFFAPEQVADCLAQARVRVASLTDHDTLEGIERFRTALLQRGIGFLSGVEITAMESSGPIHLLAYGFDPSDKNLRALLYSIRSQYYITPAVMMERFRAVCLRVLHRTRGRRRETTFQPDCSGIPEIARAVHAAGGRLFLAHPLVVCEELDELDRALEAFKNEGLDGIEAVYGPYDDAMRENLVQLAGNHGLLISFGTDFHGGPNFPSLNRVGIDIPEEQWEAFREALGVPLESGPDGSDQ